MAKAASNNNAPETRWFSYELACGTRRYQLYVDGAETPYFIDVARYRAHYSYGSKIGLWIAGASPRGCAAIGGTFDKISIAKHRAEQMALSAA